MPARGEDPCHEAPPLSEAGDPGRKLGEHLVGVREGVKPFML